MVITNTLDKLTGQTKGAVLRPGDTGYDNARAGFQAAYRHRPSVIVRATDAADVQAAVQYAAALELPVAVQSTGHGLTVPAEDGVLVDTSAMAEVRVDPGARTAWIAAGTRWGQVVDEAARHGLAPLSGSSPDVGAIGYTVGGGLGVLARQYGYAADHGRAGWVRSPMPSCSGRYAARAATSAWSPAWRSSCSRCAGSTAVGCTSTPTRCRPCWPPTGSGPP